MRVSINFTKTEQSHSTGWIWGNHTNGKLPTVLLAAVDNTSRPIQGRPKVCVSGGGEVLNTGQGSEGLEGHLASRKDHCPFHNSTLDPKGLDWDGPDAACISAALGQRWTLSFEF